jgi:hypothetical protein
MKILYKNNYKKKGTFPNPLIIEFGCGSIKRNPSSVGVDLIDTPAVDIVGDVYEVLKEIESSTVDRVEAYHFVEHLNDLKLFVTELERVLKPGAEAVLVVPHFSCPYFYSDPTHKSFFGLYTFCYFITASPFSRKVPNYGVELDFSLASVDIIFKSARPFYFRHAIKKIVGFVFNSSYFMKEFYEENFSYIFPCYEIRYVLRRL